MPTIGQTLKHAREIRGLTITEAALETNIQSPRIEAIESDDFSRLPPPAYVKGFIRIYARYLDLDPDPLVQEYLSQHAPKDFQPSMKADPEPPQAASNQGEGQHTRPGPSLLQQLLRQLRRIPPGRIVGIVGLVLLAWFVIYASGRVVKSIMDREPEVVEQLKDMPSTIVKTPPEPYFDIH